MSWNVIQSHAQSCNVCKVSRQVESHTCSVNFTLLSLCFTAVQFFQVFGEKWLSTTGGLWNSYWCFYLISSEMIFIHRTLHKFSFLQYPFCSIDEHKGAWSKESDWGYLMLTIGSSQYSGSPFISENLYPPWRSSQFPLLINLPWNDLAGGNAWPLVYLFKDV